MLKGWDVGLCIQDEKKSIFFLNRRMIEAKLRKILKLSERFLETQIANYHLPEDVRWEIALHERLLKGIIIFRFFAG